MENHTLIVLGMHRSGTSCLTGLLQQAGLVLGDVVESAPHNKKGNRENLDIRALNEDVFTYSGAAWDLPPTELRWNGKHAARRDEIIRRYNEYPVWGFKDPRAVFTLPFWLEGLSAKRPEYVGTFRHPLQVAKSLRARDPDCGIEKGLDLWRRYNDKLLELYEAHAFPVLDFDLDSASYLRAFLSALLRLEGLPKSPDTQLDFFDDALRHQTLPSTAELHRYAKALESVMPLYEKLRLLA